MKTLIFTTAVIAAIFILLQSFTSLSVIKTETQKYRVVFKEKDFEIRFYPSATIATIKSNARTYREMANPGFRSLAGYIFGGNESKTKISMTSPVHMDVNDSVSSMSFVMPSALSLADLPKPNDPGVIIQKTESEYVAAIRFGGFASDRKLKSNTRKLQKLLLEKGITPKGHYRYLGYNPPFQLFGRRNEIIVSVNWKE